MQVTIREKNPGPKIGITVNGEPIIEASAPVTPETPVSTEPEKKN